ncbi:hypothetical protein CHU95_14525 [Niveispirillum lacus]|uniref:CopL family metal-binding regulatory protein n=1 Tax=Niveispirillum lacus TaxID=1981099 RepID=A0A255YYU4_9PROT|nr:hypothetical protein [Niveispirillum lacus]OYQ33590.1 hypothetical protein CHU95_14525 [Niveispirillum lacus]
MCHIASFWTGLLKAGAVALVLTLFGFATASAHEGHHDHHASTVPAAAHQVLAVSGDCHEQGGAQPVSASHDHAHKHGQGMGDDCCKDACTCGCAATCAAHITAGLPVVTTLMHPVPAGLLLPGRALDPAGWATPPEPRPPLSI